MSRPRSSRISFKCKNCGIEFEKPGYYVRIHGDAQFHNRECQCIYRTKQGLLRWSNQKNKNTFTKIIGNVI